MYLTLPLALSKTLSSWFPGIQGVAAFPAFYAFHTRLELYALESSMQVFPNNLQIDTPQNTTV